MRVSNVRLDPVAKTDRDRSLLAGSPLLPFVLVTALFFLWGIPNNLNDVLIRQFMKSFELTRFKAGLVQSAFYMGYFLLSMPAALVMRRFSYKAGLVTGLMLYSVGTLLFWPAAVVGGSSHSSCARCLSSPAWWRFWKPAANPFIAQFGIGTPPVPAPGLNFSQAFNPLGAITGALVGATVFIFPESNCAPERIHELQVSESVSGLPAF